MAKFRDNQQREWVLSIDIPLAREIRSQLDVDILDADEGLTKLSSDPILFCDVLYRLIRGQAEKREVSDEDFGRSLQGEALEAAADAFFEALLAFCPPRRRKVLAALDRTARTLEETLTGMATQKEAELQRLLGSTGGSRSPAGAESSATNRPAPSAS